MLEQVQGIPWVLLCLCLSGLLCMTFVMGGISRGGSWHPSLFLFFKSARCNSVASFWVLCRGVLTKQGRIIMRNRIRVVTAAWLKIVDRMFFSWNKVQKCMKKKSFAAPAAVKSNREYSMVFIWVWSFPKFKLMLELFHTPEIWFLIFWSYNLSHLLSGVLQQSTSSQHDRTVTILHLMPAMQSQYALLLPPGHLPAFLISYL